jgi:hypothetical protein
LLAACVAPEATVGLVPIRIQVDGKTIETFVPSGSSVQGALLAAGIDLGELDKVEPASFTVVVPDTIVRVTRVEERFVIEEVVLPFQRQTIRNETLPEGETRLLQAGKNGLEEITYRIVLQESVEVSRQPVKTHRVSEPVPEIIMIGAQPSYAPSTIEGTLAYASGGNAWVMRMDTGNRRPLLLSADLDGRVFRLSTDGEYLLFSRTAPRGSSHINALWVVSTTDAQPVASPLGVQNVVHFADWSPALPSGESSNYIVCYSTVEPSPASPGWQANNDLAEIALSPTGTILRKDTLIPTNAGGQYGWWGTLFAWAPDGERLAFSRPDAVGTVAVADPRFTVLREFAPFQTLGDWAWTPGLSWGPDGRTLFTVDHGSPIALEEESASPVFHLAALTPGDQAPLTLAERVGMFASPVVSPRLDLPKPEQGYRIAYLQALSPLQSDQSGYRLAIMDRDGSNRLLLFPPEGEPGLQPQSVAWSPEGERIAVLYRGDLYLVDPATAVAQRITGDGQISAFDWRH